MGFACICSPTTTLYVVHFIFLALMFVYVLSLDMFLSIVALAFLSTFLNVYRFSSCLSLFLSAFASLLEIAFLSLILFIFHCVVSLVLIHVSVYFNVSF